MRAAQDIPLPPHPLDKNWYAHIDGKSYGPYSGHEIGRMIGTGQILESDFVCPEGGNAWTPAKSDPLLGSLFVTKKHNSEPQVSTIKGEGQTVVQVTNTTSSPNLAQAALLLNTEGAAAKSPGIALLLSLLFCGIGQMYNGQVGKGILMLIGSILAWFVLLGWVIWIWSMIDAYHTAKTMNLRYQQRILAGLM